MDHSLPRSSVYGILQARILEWVAFSPAGDLPDPRITPESVIISPVLAGGFLATSATWEFHRESCVHLRLLLSPQNVVS